MIEKNLKRFDELVGDLGHVFHDMIDLVRKDSAVMELDVSRRLFEFKEREAIRIQSEKKREAKRIQSEKKREADRLAESSEAPKSVLEINVGHPSDSKVYDHTDHAFAPPTMEIERILFMDIKTLLEAVGHVGCDFGHGPYQLSAQQIKRAQELYAALNT